jgi:hypothetical protein
MIKGIIKQIPKRPYLGSSRHSKNMFEMIGNTVRDAVVGGTISVIGGGKFANGAQTGA